jgi:hypothetical protein
MPHRLQLLNSALVGNRATDSLATYLVALMALLAVQHRLQMPMQVVSTSTLGLVPQALVVA